MHWLTAILVLLAFIYGPGGSEQRVYSAARDAQRRLHETLGISVLALVVIRLAWRAIDTRPLRELLPAWMGWLSRATHLALYLLLFAVPLTAITGAWLEAHPLTFLGGLDAAPWLPESHDLGARIASVHTWLGDAILWLAGLHALAALFHHVFLRDGVLVSMLPRWFPLRRPGA